MPLPEHAFWLTVPATSQQGVVSSLCSVEYDDLSTLTKKACRDRLGNDTVSLQYTPWKERYYADCTTVRVDRRRQCSPGYESYTSAGAGSVPEGSCPDHTWACHCGAGWRASGWTWPRCGAEPAASRDLVYRE